MTDPLSSTILSSYIEKCWVFIGGDANLLNKHSCAELFEDFDLKLYPLEGKRVFCVVL